MDKYDNIRKESGNEDQGSISYQEDPLYRLTDPDITEKIDDYMRAQADLDEITSDPFLATVRAEVAGMIADHNRSAEKDLIEENRKFIYDALCEAESEKKIRSEIRSIKIESGKSRINEITADWVNEWHKKKQMLGAKPVIADERKSFVTESLKAEPELEIIPVIQKPEKRSAVIRYITLSAAAVIGLLICINSLLPSRDSLKIYNEFYQPYDAFSPVVRGKSNVADVYKSALNLYKTGAYEKAEAGFIQSAEQDPAYGYPDFFLGLTSIARGNYDMAIDKFTAVVDDSSEYSKEAQWYLGLALLKKGDKIKAADCFEKLSSSKGYYQSRSMKILRRLK